MTRVVIDANVLASATAGHPDSPSRRLLDALASAGSTRCCATGSSRSSIARFSARISPRA
jgi:predicted nucleic acid-binding protein